MNIFMCCFSCQAQNIPFSRFIPDFKVSVQSKMAAKMVTIVGDVTSLQQRHHPKNIPHLVEKIKGFPLKAKSFGNTATYQKL